jgi:hypothetical protein
VLLWQVYGCDRHRAVPTRRPALSRPAFYLRVRAPTRRPALEMSIALQEGGAEGAASSANRSTSSEGCQAPMGGLAPVGS